MPRQRGVTLFELLVVVAIIGILAAIAYPAYTDQIRKGRRAEAQSVLQDLALSQEQWRTNDVDYASLAELGGDPGIDMYTVTVPTNTATAFTIRAVASGDQASDTAGGASCTTLTINESNVKTPPECW